MKDLVGFYPSRQQAEQVRDALEQSGFSSNNITVYDRGGKSETGFWEDLKAAFGFVDESEQALYAEATRRGSVAVAVRVEDGSESSADRALSIMKQQQPIDLETNARQWRSEGAQAGLDQSAEASATTRPIAADAPQQTRAATPAASRSAGDVEEVVPVVEEQLQVGKRSVQAGGIRIHTRVTEKPVEQQVQVREEHVNVERRPVDRPLGESDRPFQERSFEVTETREEPIVAKQARVVEEVVVNKQAGQRTQTVRDSVRRTDVDVQRTDAGAARSDADADRFATELASDERYRGSDWDRIEPEARSSYEKRYPGSTWDQVKDSVRRGWDRARQKV